MKHLGDITKINGAEAPVVNVIIGGSPCQDLSLAGKRKGLTGERSGLFMEQLRIIKEMREADEARGRTDEHIRPRFMVWENVPGAFSTNGGKDFGAVLHETVKIACHNAPPVPMFGNKWAKSGCLVDVDGKWSIAWRVFDAQFWGVPQRRRRIALVADFGGQSAPEILFERKSVSRNFEESGTAWKRAATDFGKRTKATVFGKDSKDSNSMKSENPKSGFYEADVTRTLDCNGGNPSCNQGGTAVVQSKVSSIDGGESVYSMTTGEYMTVSKNQASTLFARDYKDPQCVVYQCSCESRSGTPRPDARKFADCGSKEGRIVAGFKSSPSEKAGSVAYGIETAPCLSAATHDACVMILENHPNDSRVKIAEDGMDNFNAVIALDRASFNQGKNAQYDFEVSESGINSSLVARGPSAVCSKEKSECERYIVRRLMPLECERLQGFPDFWTDIGEWTDSKGKLHKESSDSARYAALGNSIALPSWFYVLSKLSEFCEEKTMASLFDGISGFNVCWARIHGAENCLWSSEIEEFPIAVVKKHFGDEDTGEEGDFEKFFRRDEKENV